MSKTCAKRLRGEKLRATLLSFGDGASIESRWLLIEKRCGGIRLRWYMRSRVRRKRRIWAAPEGPISGIFPHACIL